eukprot:Rmarinus@m.22627
MPFSEGTPLAVCSSQWKFLDPKMVSPILLPPKKGRLPAHVLSPVPRVSPGPSPPPPIGTEDEKSYTSRSVPPMDFGFQAFLSPREESALIQDAMREPPDPKHYAEFLDEEERELLFGILKDSELFGAGKSGPECDGQGARSQSARSRGGRSQAMLSGQPSDEPPTPRSLAGSSVVPGDPAVVASDFGSATGAGRSDGGCDGLDGDGGGDGIGEGKSGAVAAQRLSNMDSTVQHSSSPEPASPGASQSVVTTGEGEGAPGGQAQGKMSEEDLSQGASEKASGDGDREHRKTKAHGSAPSSARSSVHSYSPSHVPSHSSRVSGSQPLGPGHAAADTLEDLLERPLSPMIIWRPSARVRLATNLPPELQAHLDSLAPVQESPGDPGHTPLLTMSPGMSSAHSPMVLPRQGAAANAGRPAGGGPPYHTRVINKPMYGYKGPQVESSFTFRPKVVQRPPQYGAWYVPPKNWTVGAAMPPPPKKKSTLLTDEDLDEREELVANQLSKLYGCKIYKEYVKNEGWHMPKFLERVQSPKPGGANGGAQWTDTPVTRHRTNSSHPKPPAERGSVSGSIRNRALRMARPTW